METPPLVEVEIVRSMTSESSTYARREGTLSLRQHLDVGSIAEIGPRWI